MWSFIVASLSQSSMQCGAPRKNHSARTPRDKHVNFDLKLQARFIITVFIISCYFCLLVVLITLPTQPSTHEAFISTSSRLPLHFSTFTRASHRQTCWQYFWRDVAVFCQPKLIPPKKNDLVHSFLNLTTISTKIAGYTGKHSCSQQRGGCGNAYSISSSLSKHRIECIQCQIWYLNITVRCPHKPSCTHGEDEALEPTLNKSTHNSKHWHAFLFVRIISLCPNPNIIASFVFKRNCFLFCRIFPLTRHLSTPTDFVMLVLLLTRFSLPRTSCSNLSVEEMR